MSPRDWFGVALEITQRALAAACAEVERAYPDEGCGVLYGPVEPPGLVDLCRAVANVQDELHRSEPLAHPRSARSAFALPLPIVLELARGAPHEGRTAKVVFHSHPEGDAGFSEMDRALALAGGPEPAYALQHLVLAVRRVASGPPRVRRACLYDFSRVHGEFQLARELPTAAR